MLVTITFDIFSKESEKVILEGCNIDIEVSPEEYRRMTVSFESNKFMYMDDDKDLSDIVKRCNAEVSKWDNGSDEDDGFCRFDYPLEVRIDHAEPVWHAGFDSIANDELIPSDARLIEKENDNVKIT